MLVLTKNADFKEDDLKALELPPEVKLLHEYKIANSNIVKFGDVDGSGKYAIVDILNDYSTIVYANDGHELWRWTAPPTSRDDPRGNEAAGILWDFHHTGRDELAHWRESSDGKEWLVLADGRTGDGHQAGAVACARAAACGQQLPHGGGEVPQGFRRPGHAAGAGGYRRHGSGWRRTTRT